MTTEGGVELKLNVVLGEVIEAVAAQQLSEACTLLTEGVDVEDVALADERERVGAQELLYVAVLDVVGYALYAVGLTLLGLVDDLGGFFILVVVDGETLGGGEEAPGGHLGTDVLGTADGECGVDDDGRCAHTTEDVVPEIVLCGVGLQIEPGANAEDVECGLLLYVLAHLGGGYALLLGSVFVGLYAVGCEDVATLGDVTLDAAGGHDEGCDSCCDHRQTPLPKCPHSCSVLEIWVKDTKKTPKREMLRGGIDGAYESYGSYMSYRPYKSYTLAPTKKAPPFGRCFREYMLQVASLHCNYFS